MVNRIKEEMEPFETGLLIVGMGHMHSILSKLMLRTSAFEATVGWVDNYCGGERSGWLDSKTFRHGIRLPT
jgi:hypothetical protein